MCAGTAAALMATAAPADHAQLGLRLGQSDLGCEHGSQQRVVVNQVGAPVAAHAGARIP